MSTLNDNVCECGHTKYEHVINQKFEPTFCSFNQKICDCWQFKVRYVEHREYAITLNWGGK